MLVDAALNVAAFVQHDSLVLGRGSGAVEPSVAYCQQLFGEVLGVQGVATDGGP